MAKTTNAWRDLIIEIIKDGPVSDEALNESERETQTRVLSELIGSNHGRGIVRRDHIGQIAAVHWDGPTTEGRLLADQLAGEKHKESFAYFIREAAIGVIGWLSGMASAWFIWWLTK